jgi:hypothetical protein
MPIKMNCCDEYGNCRQGRDCPVRVQPFKQSSMRLGYWILMSVAGVLWLALLIYYVYKRVPDLSIISACLRGAAPTLGMLM